MSERSKVVVVDDNPGNRYAVARVLRAEGYEVIEGASAADALRLTRSEQPEVLVLDIKLPDMLGFEVNRILREDPITRHVSILNMSASYTGPESQALGLGRGADAYLVHPIDPLVLRATIHALLRLRAHERERSRLLRELEEALRARDEFLSIASHDLKGPLAAMALELDMLMRAAARDGGVLSGDSVVPKLTGLRKQVDQLVCLLEDLLDISRIASGKLTIRRERIDLDAAARNALERLAEQAKRSGSEVTLRSSGPVVGYWDPLRVGQVITNLLTNALAYGSGHPIEVELAATPTAALLSVRDHGVGISSSDLQRIFQRFERVQSSREAKSYGLGLWIVQRIVEALQGSISVVSHPGEGSTFTVELPRNAP
ncbi:MAG: hybrid sensor histidine kinase/response regulator [Pseudomonadota bacterium]|nr:MAG: hybrid sensor histidine kinase/response regulator [Pseudomonadota bacterium]